MWLLKMFEKKLHVGILTNCNQWKMGSVPLHMATLDEKLSWKGLNWNCFNNLGMTTIFISKFNRSHLMASESSRRGGSRYLFIEQGWPIFRIHTKMSWGIWLPFFFWDPPPFSQVCPNFIFQCWITKNYTKNKLNCETKRKDETLGSFHFISLLSTLQSEWGSLLFMVGL